jgi:raffinose/stachyose/melibiose transport system permease protein
VSRTRAPGQPAPAVGLLYAAPAVIIFALFMAWPLVRAVQLSLFEWDGLSLGRFVGLDNYRDVLLDPQLREPFGHALVLLIFFSLLPITLGIALAALMSRITVLTTGRLRGLGFFRTMIFLPQVMAMVVVAIAWRAIYAPQGPLNEVLRGIGLDGAARAWLGEPMFALPAVGLVGTWVGTGLCMVLFLAGLAKVPRELYEAATLDGAGPVRQFITIGLPELRGEIAVALTLTVVAALRTFDLVYVMTRGGPGTSTRVPSYEVYRWALEDGKVGYGVTIAIMLTVVILLITMLVNRIAEREA